MDERKLRIAFAKVKKDILSIKDDLYDLNKVETAPKTDFSEKLKFDNFVKNVENELKALTLYTKELDDKIEHNGKATTTAVKTSSTPNKDLEDNFQQLEGRFADFTELINEKVEMEINSLRLEFTEEVAKIYDRIFTEILELKDEMNNNSGNKKEEKPKKKSKKASKKKTDDKKEDNENELYSSVSEQAEKKNPSKMKKVMNWLFVDEEDDEMDDIKSEVKNIKEEDKDGLY